LLRLKKPEALENIHEIIDLADGMMVARGDLGVELPAQKYPLLQSRLVQIANEYNKPVIVATQMLESLIEHGTAYQGRSNDVASACLQGADAVMLSAETAAGKYPIEAIKMMDTILRETETYQFLPTVADLKDTANEHTTNYIMPLELRLPTICRSDGEKCFCCYQNRIYCQNYFFRPPFCSDHNFLQFLIESGKKLNLLWGIYPFYIKDDTNSVNYLNEGEELLKKLGLAKAGDYTLFVSSITDRLNENHSIMVHQVY